MTMNDCAHHFLSNSLAGFGNKPNLLVYKEDGKWINISTEETIKITDNLAAKFVAMGLSTPPNTPIENKFKIALVSRNRPEWLMLDFACQKAGVILCPIYPTTNPIELEYIFNDASIEHCFVSGDDIADKVDSIKGNVPTLKNVYSFDEGLKNTIYWKTLTNEISNDELENLKTVTSTITNKECFTIIYTSGTTGKPKGVMLSHENIVSNVLNAVASFPFEKNLNGKALSFLPLNHIFERMVSMIYFKSGYSIYFAESLETIGDNLKEVQPNLFSTVPRLLEKVYDKIMAKGSELTGTKRKLFDWAVNLANNYDDQSNSFFYKTKLAIANKIIFSKWREALGGNIDFIITGGAACQVRLIRIFTAAKIPIFEGYGPTENSPVISVNRIEKGGTRFGTVGPVIEGQTVKIMEDGEICVKGPSVMMGYYKQPVLTAETLIDGWLHTGDIGIFVEDRFLKITDRKKELFKTSGGKYVAPQPIENKMKESPFVEQMMVIGAEEKFVGAFIVPSFPTLREWMHQKGISFTTEQDAVQNPKVLELYRQLIDSFNNFFNHVEQVKKFELLPEEWTIASGELTPTLKLKRKVIMEKYKNEYARIYE